MTGYARAQGSDDRRRWVWEARSVNGRNLEIRCRVPPGFDRLENPARVAVGGKMKRGNVSLTLTVTSERSAKPLTINRDLLAELATLVDEVRRTTGAAAPSADGLLRVRGVIEEEDAGAETEEALKEIGLTRIRSADQQIGTLSGGERQSVAIQRATHFGARLLLLDEPTAALSVRETRNVLESIRHARDQGLGVIYIDHNMGHVLPVADRIVLLELGRIKRILDRDEVGVEELQDLVARRS